MLLCLCSPCAREYRESEEIRRNSKNADENSLYRDPEIWTAEKEESDPEDGRKSETQMIASRRKRETWSSARQKASEKHTVSIWNEVTQNQAPEQPVETVNKSRIQ